MSTKTLKIAALACSFNRKQVTNTLFTSLFAQELPEGCQMDVFLTDDKSTDGTVDLVTTNFPEVIIIEGTGSLFWGGGMRRSWEVALKKDDYDFYLLLNDDVRLVDGALLNLLAARAKSNFPENITLGTVLDVRTDKITYGGHRLRNWTTGRAETVIPDKTELLEAHLGNGNVMLVDKATVDKVGQLSGKYIHGLADFDYTLTAVEKGVKVWVAPGFYGYCANNHGKPWISGDQPFKKRLAYLYSPTGVAYHQYMYYTRRHFPLMLPAAFFKAWLKTLVPVLYDKFKKQW